MKVLLILPDFIVQKFQIARCCESLRLYYGECDVILASSFSQIDIYKQRGVDVIPFDIQALLTEYDHLALIYDQEICQPIPEVAYSLQARSSSPVVGFNVRDHFISCYPIMPEFRMDHPHCQSHVFMRLGRPLTRDGSYCYFPYGGIWHGPGRGPINDFGFRIEGDVSQYEKRDPDHKLVTIFGGSATFSESCLYTEMFSTLLEKKLNKASLKGYRYTVLNFGVPRSVLIEEMITYLIHAMPLKPDYVISHDGFNDFFCGPACDPALVGKHNMIYQTSLQLLAQKLSNCHNDDLACRDSHSVITDVQCSSQLVLNAFLMRKEQFETLVHNNGAHFIHGLHPILFDKQDLNPIEKTYLDGLMSNQAHGIYKNYALIKDLFDHLRQSSFWGVRNNKVDFKKLFITLKSEHLHFIDLCHLMPYGDQVVSDGYASYILQREMAE